MQAFRVAATIGTGGELMLPAVPFRPGARVEVIVLEDFPRGNTPESGTERLQQLRAARGIWEDRTDLPDFTALRRELDRSPSGNQA